MDVGATGEMGKVDFLNLLATQLRNQNPLSPVDNTQFIAQLAQFSALDATEKMSQQEMKVVAAALLGKQVSGVVTDENKNQVAFSGTVTGVNLGESIPRLYVNGRPVSLNDVVSVEN